MKKKILIGIVIVLVIVFLIVINSEHWNLETCNSECVHRGYDTGDCRWPLEISDDEINIGSCLIPNSRYCENKGQCNCYCKILITNFKECAEAGYAIMESYPRQCRAGNKTFTEILDEPIGGETDEHGCVLMGGYTWCESKQKCLRNWEEGCEDCEQNPDCVVFGEDGDCNCGCYNKDMMPTSSGGDCFCAAPTSCECVEGKCEGV